MNNERRGIAKELEAIKQGLLKVFDPTMVLGI